MGFKDVIVWLFIFIMGSLIVSFLIYPGSFQSFKSNFGGISGNVISSIEDKFSSVDNSAPCSEEVKREIERRKRQYGQISSDYNLRISQQKKFDSVAEVKSYLYDLNPTYESAEEEITKNLESYDLTEKIYTFVLKQTGTVEAFGQRVYSNERLFGICLNETYEELGNLDWDY